MPSERSPETHWSHLGSDEQKRHLDEIIAAKLARRAVLAADGAPICKREGHDPGEITASVDQFRVTCK